MMSDMKQEERKSTVVPPFCYHYSTDQDLREQSSCHRHVILVVPDGHQKSMERKRLFVVVGLLLVYWKQLIFL